MKITAGPLSGLLILEPNVFKDERGYFYEVFQAKRYAEMGMPPFVQDNFSHSTRNIIRGLHFQKPHPQGKLVYVTQGHVFDVAVDIRKSSATFGKWFGIHLSDENHIQLYIPPGFAHGFCTLSDEANFNYKCTEYYFPESETGIAYNDKQLNIAWPVENPILSDKDKKLPCLHECENDRLFA